MKGDFTRSTFRPTDHYNSVRLQQGRVLLDADWNEQADIQAHRERNTARDVVGHSGAPLRNAGFALSVEKKVEGSNNLKIGGGHYYVDGILCSNEQEVSFAAEPALPGVPGQPDVPDSTLPTDPGRYLAYLDVWERHITALEDPRIREVALGGPDTTTRVKTVWQVRLGRLQPGESHGTFGAGWLPKGAGNSGLLRARASEAALGGVTSDDSPAGSATSGYRRLENQLYRVEIHDGGEPYGAPRSQKTAVSEGVTPDQVKVENDGWTWRAGQTVELFSEASEAPGTLASITQVDTTTGTLTLDKDLSEVTPKPTNVRQITTFKFSRDNGTTLAWLTGIQEDRITISDIGKDPMVGFSGDQWVELSDEERTLRAEPGVLVEVGSAPEDSLAVRNWPNGTPLTMADFRTRPTVRRWDSERALPVSVGAWLNLEDGVQVEFGIDTDDTGNRGTYNSGDYWLIAARSLTRSVEWPQDPAGVPSFEPRHGIEHHYAPLALLQLADDGTWTLESDLRRLFAPLAEGANIHVAGVFLGSDKSILPNDPVRAADLADQGIRVACESMISPDTANGRRLCSVTLELPFPSNEQERQIWGKQVIGSQPLTLLANEQLASSRNTDILWKASTETQDWLKNKLPQVIDQDSVRANLVLHGSTFETWFWLSLQRVEQTGIGFIPNLGLKPEDRGYPFKIGTEVRNNLSRALNLGMDRVRLQKVLPPDYSIDEDATYDEVRARALINFLKDSDGRFDPFWVILVHRPTFQDQQRSFAGRETLSNMLENIGIETLDWGLVENVDEIGKYLQEPTFEFAPLVIIGNEDLAQELFDAGEELSGRFDSNLLIHF